MLENNSLPASLAIGRSPKEPQQRTFEDLLKKVDRDYKGFLSGHEWDERDTKGLVLALKIALEQTQAKLEANKADFLKLLELTEGLMEVTRRRDTFSDDYITATQDIIALIKKNAT
jgi:hypothetical protein